MGSALVNIYWARQIERVPFYGWESSERVKFEVNWHSKLPSESEEFDIMGLACGPDGFDDC